MTLEFLHPITRAWFMRRFAGPTEAQRRGWPAITRGEDTLIAAPTGSGKTLAAFLASIDRLLRLAIAGELGEATRVVYVSPLRALSNDIHRNLEEPLAELLAAAREAHPEALEIRAAVRTGDTPARARQRMIERPPHILVTTPESLYLLLTSERSRETLRAVETLIVDELHAIAPDKRGAHLALSLERLSFLAAKRPQRIGLSATQSPIEEIARFLAGPSPLPTIVDAGHVRTLDLGIEVPGFTLGAVCMHEHWEKVYERFVDLIQTHRSTLIFVNTRRLAERVTHQLGERLHPRAVASHHGSLAQHIRRDAEERLKSGELKAVVATASLELGIDVGHIDLVCQVSSPRSIAGFLQRVGRAGHSLHATPKGRLFPLTRDDLLECLALVRSVKAGELDAIQIPRAPLDVLAQQLVAEVAAEEHSEDDLWRLCRSAYPYRNLERADFEGLLDLLSEGIASARGRRGAFLHRDRVNRMVRPRRGARLVAITCGGAIADVGSYRVVTEDDRRTVVGTVDEDFAVESSAGDIFILGNTSWMIQRLRGNDMMVIDVQGAPPSVPFWRGEAPGRTVELSRAVSELRGDLARRLMPSPNGSNEAAAWLREETSVDAAGAAQAVEYVAAQLQATGFVPTDRRVLFERFFDDTGGMQIVIHAPFGTRINRAWGLALRKRFCRSFDFELQASADDNGIVLSLGQQHSFPLEDLPVMLRKETARHLLEQAVLAVPFFTSRWRWNAARALAIKRFDRGRPVPPPLLRMRSDDLLTAVFPAQTACLENVTGDIEIPDHLLVRQTMDDTLHDAMDVDGLLDLLARIERGAVDIVTLDTTEPSPFSHERLNANPYAFLDDAPLEERRARAVSMRRTLPIEAASELGRLEPEAIAVVVRDAWPTVRDRNELHDVLLSLVAVSDREMVDWRLWADALLTEGRVTRWAVAENEPRWVATERVPLARALWPDGAASPPVTVPEELSNDVAREDASLAHVRGWLEVLGPVSAEALAERLGLPQADISIALAALERTGVVLQGRFTPNAAHTEWCERGLLARIHRLTLAELRRRIQPVSVETFVRFLVRHQHAHPDTRLRGVRGVALLIDQLEGFEAPAAHWERHLLAARLDRYDPSWVDQLALAGGAMWGRVRPNAGKKVEENGGSTAQPVRAFGRNLPITLFRRDHFSWLRPARALGTPPLSTRAGAVFDSLRTGGALFRSQLAQRTRLLPSELDEALSELAAAGLVTSDGFEPLRGLARTSARQLLVEQSRDPALQRSLRRSRRVAKTGRPAGLRTTTNDSGRWALLLDGGDAPASTDNHRIEEWCRLLLRRYGLVCRDVLARETIAPAWGELVRTYRVLEARGEIRGGRFVADLAGEQYALPEVVPTLRALAERTEEDPPLTLAATDPLNVFGRIVPGTKVPAVASNRVSIHNGRLAVDATTAS